ncbi:Lysophosphatidylcholine acyltransferase 1 [Coccomyxa sp. Obi]|nr:Lysophosphatidylcholine acyltransferase 1 [Coccomyxa sp. Obi]
MLRSKSDSGPLNLQNELYEPFVRHDQYGPLGAKPQPLLEYLRLAVLLVTLAPIKFTSATLCVVAVHLLCRVSVILPKGIQAQVVASLGKVLCRLCLLCWGFVKIDWTTDEPRQLPKGVEPAAIVSNHISYLDIIVHCAHSFPSFVARGNTKDLPLVGLISKHLQCIYVNRDFKKGDVTGVSGQVKDRMELAAAGKLPPTTRPLLLFPEGTTTNGVCLLPFKSGAFLAGAPVQPVILRYGEDRVSPAWDSISPLWHALLLLANPFHSVTARQLPIYHPSEEEKADPKLYAANVREMMLREGGFKASESSLLESRAYIALLEGRKPPPKSQAAQALGIKANGVQSNGKPSGDGAGIADVPVAPGVKKAE